MNYENGAFATGNKMQIGPNGEKLSKTHITTYTHKVLDLSDPQPDGICLQDIAHGLSMHVRWAGQGRWMSVAQHSVLVLRQVERGAEQHGLKRPVGLLRAALMHDAHEAYIGDMSGGLKYLLRDSVLKSLILALDDAIERAIPNLSFITSKEWDNVIKFAEEDLLIPEYDLLFLGEPSDLIEGPLCQAFSEELFLTEAARLGMAG